MTGIELRLNTWDVEQKIWSVASVKRPIFSMSGSMSMVTRSLLRLGLGDVVGAVATVAAVAGALAVVAAVVATCVGAPVVSAAATHAIDVILLGGRCDPVSC